MMDPIEFKNLTEQLIGCEAFNSEMRSLGFIISCEPVPIERGDYKVMVKTNSGLPQNLKASVALFDGKTLSCKGYSSWTVDMMKEDSCRRCRARCKADKVCGLYDPLVRRN